MLPFLAHLPHTHSLPDMAFSRGQPRWGAHLAEDLERLVLLHGVGRLTHAQVEFGVVPDMITCAKGLTNGIVPAGAVICQPKLFQTIQGAAHVNPGTQIEFFHGYTYSGHPLAMAAGLAALEVFSEQNIFENVKQLSPFFEDLLHSRLAGLPHVVDVRNYGFMAGVEVAAIKDWPTKRALDIFDRCFQKGVMKKHLEQMVDTLAAAIKESAANLT
eukprot:gene28977-38018_t